MTETISSGMVVGYRYAIRSDTGTLLASTDPDEIIYYLHGAGTSPPGLESHMEGRAAGDNFSAKLEPRDAFGEREQNERLLAVPRSNFPEDADVEPGMRVLADTEQGVTISLWVTDVDQDKVMLDRNHPLAGHTLHFDVQVISIRRATKDEVTHGHVHD